LGLGLGVALTAWTLGARHAFDADHISAIDNTTRKLMADGKRPLATGFLWRFFGRFMRAITKTWHMYVAGLVFGIGFDTATEVLLLAATAAAAAQGLPWYAVLALPLVFSGGMMLFDTADGCFMNFAYGWAFARPVRKVYYNLVITGLSIAVAFLIGTIEITGLLSSELHIHCGFWDFMAGFDINRAGFAIAGLFVVVWAVAIAYWKLRGLDQRWTPAAPDQPTGPDPGSGQADQYTQGMP
jgi:nickel/cobalt transporter (NiCoT) family protein